MFYHRKRTTSSEAAQQAYRWALPGYRMVTGLLVCVGFLVATLPLFTLLQLGIDSATIADVLGFLGFLILFAVVDSIPLTLRDEPISLGFLVILLALGVAASRLPFAEAAPLVVMGVGTLGACLSGAVRSFFLERWPISKALARILFYAAHYTLAGFVAAQAYFWIFSTWEPLWKLKSIHVQATLIYALVYSLVSTALVLPHDFLVDRLLLPASEKRFPRITILSAIGIAPIPMALLATIGTEGGWAFIFPLFLYFAFLAITRSWTTVEIQARRLSAQERLRNVLGVPASMDDLARRVERILDDLVSYQWAALYSAEIDDEVYRLRREWQPGGNIISHDDLSGEGELTSIEDIAMEQITNTPEGQTVTWPSRVSKGQGYLGHVVEFREPLGGVDRHSWLHPAFLYLPLLYQGTIIGLLTIARSKRLFRKHEQTQVEDLTVVVAERLRQLQQLEAELKRLLGDASKFAQHPDRIQKVIRELSACRVDISKIVSQIAERSFHGNLRKVLKAVVVGGGTGRGDLSLSDDELRVIYGRVCEGTPGMPPLDDDILEKLKVIFSDLSLAFSFRFQWPEFDRGKEYTKLYDFFVQAMDVQSVADIRRLLSLAEDTLDDARLEAQLPPEVITQLSSLVKVVSLVKRSQEAAVTDQQQAYVRKAIEAIRTLDDRASERLQDPERFIFLTLIANWLTIFDRHLDALERGVAQLKLALRNNCALPTEQVTIVLVMENVGQGTASRLVAEMQSCPDYRILGPSQIKLGVLPPFRSEELEFTIQPRKEGQFRTEFVVTYRDQEREQKQVAFADVLHLRAVPPSFIPISNSYVAGVPLRTNSEVFFGREDIFEFIRRNMVSTAPQQQVLLLIGERRTGKTSILKQLPVWLSDQEYIHVFLDCEGVGADGSIASFFSDLADLIVGSLEDAGMFADRPSDDAMERNAFRIFTRQFLPQVWEKIGARRLLMAFDEYEVLENRVRSGLLGQEIFEYLRSLMQHQDRLAFIFAGTHELEAMSSDYWHIFFNIAKYHRVGFLDENAAIRLITEPVEPYNVAYDDLALDEMLRCTGGHPYFLQLLCDHLVELCNKERRNYVTVQHVRDALEYVLSAGKAHLAFIWEDSTPAERAVLTSLAQSLTFAERTTMDTISLHLGKAGIAYERQELQEAVQRLEARHIAVRKQDLRGTVHYDFATNLYYIWVKKYHSPG